MPEAPTLKEPPSPAELLKLEHMTQVTHHSDGTFTYNPSAKVRSRIVYNPDGSFTVFPADIESLPPLAKLAKESRLVRFVLRLVGLFTLALWTVIGFLLWVPLLTRMITIFFGALIAAMVSGRDPTDAKNHLDFAAAFYIRGFMLIKDAIAGVPHRSGPFFVPQQEHWYKIARELIFAIIFWISLAILWSTILNRLFTLASFTPTSIAFLVIAALIIAFVWRRSRTAPP
jgi:hypothetical protein